MKAKVYRMEYMRKDEDYEKLKVERLWGVYCWTPRWRIKRLVWETRHTLAMDAGCKNVLFLIQSKVCSTTCSFKSAMTASRLIITLKSNRPWISKVYTSVMNLTFELSRINASFVFEMTPELFVCILFIPL